MSVISTSTQYSTITIDCVNYYSGFTETVPKVDVGLTYKTSHFNVHKDAEIAQETLIPCSEINYIGTRVSEPSVLCIRKTVSESMKIVKQIYDLVKSNKITLEVWNPDKKEFYFRPLSFDDFVISGSFVLAAFYDVLNTKTQKLLEANDVDIYILTRFKSLQLDTDSKPSYHKGFIINLLIDGLKIQLIRQNAPSITNVFGFYDVDCTRGAILLKENGNVMLIQSRSMLNSLEKGINIIGFHSTDTRVAKYEARGFGTFLVYGTKIVSTEEYYKIADRTCSYSLTGLNAVRGGYCQTCKQVHDDTRQGCSIFGTICEKCLTKKGVTVVKEKMDFSVEDEDCYPLTGKHTYYLKMHKPRDELIREMMKATKSLKYLQKCFKIRVASFDIKSIDASDRRNISRILGIKEEDIISNKLSPRFKRYALRMGANDYLLKHFDLLIESCITSIVYKTTFKTEEEKYIVNIDLYLPTNQETITGHKFVLDMISQVSEISYKVSNYMPFVTGTKYKKLYKDSKAVQLLTKKASEETLIKKVPGIFLSHPDLKAVGVKKNIYAKDDPLISFDISLVDLDEKVENESDSETETGSGSDSESE